MGKVSKTLCLLLIAAICTVWFIYALNGYPLLSGDTVCFLPAAIELKNGNGLINHLYHPLGYAENRFIFYPPFFPWAMAVLTPSSSGVSIFMGLYVVQVASFLITLAILYNIYQRQQRTATSSPAWQTLFVLITIFAASACFGAGYSRPEALCKLLLVSALYLMQSRISYKLWVIGLLNVASVLTSPVFGAYMLLLSSLYLVVSKQLKFGSIAQMGLAMLAGLVAAYLVYPYRLVDLVGGMRQHSQNVVFDKGDTGLTIQNFISQHIASTETPLGIFFFVTAAAIGIYFLIRNPRLSVVERVLALAITIVLLVTINYFSFKTIFMSYYMYVLAPLMLILVLYGALRNRKVLVVASLLFMAFSVPSIRLGLLFLSNGTYGSTFNISQTSERLTRKYPALETAKVGYTPSLWPIFINNSRAELVRFHNSPIDTQNGKFSRLIIQQVNSNLTSPPAIPGYKLVENNFSATPVKAFNIKIANQPLAYQYAVYERE